MRELITIHIGQCGSQIGESIWELFCLEHGISPTGFPSTNTYTNNYSQSIFAENSSGKQVPRSIFIDLEPSIIDQIRTGTNRELFRPNSLISGKEDASHLFSRAQCSTGRPILDQCKDEIRKSTDNCSNLDGFIISNSIQGGSGSGMLSLIIEHLSSAFPKKPIFTASLTPSPQYSSIIVEPYNAVYTMNTLTEFADVSLIFDNQALYNIASNQLDIEQPSFKNINALVAQVISELTVSMRFPGALNTTLSEFLTNTVPYHKLHFMLSSFTPFKSVENIKTSTEGDPNLHDITSTVFSGSNLMASCDQIRGKYMASSLIYRGDVSQMDVISSISQIRSRKTVQFVDWIPTGVKVGITHEIPKSLVTTAKRTCSLITNSTAMLDNLSSLHLVFDKLWSKRAFYHWVVGEGCAGEEIYDCRRALSALEKDYEEVSNY